jgi:hypothetical protein
MVLCVVLVLLYACMQTFTHMSQAIGQHCQCYMADVSQLAEPEYLGCPPCLQELQSLVERAAVQAMGTSAGSQGAQGAPGADDSTRPALQRTSSGTLQLDKDVFWFAAQVRGDDSPSHISKQGTAVDSLCMLPDLQLLHVPYARTFLQAITDTRPPPWLYLPAPCSPRTASAGPCCPVCRC